MRTFTFLKKQDYNASGNSDSFLVENGYEKLAITLNVYSATGTSPTLDVTIEDSVDGVEWNTVATCTQKTGAGKETVRVDQPIHKYLRISYTLGGTSPSFNLDIKSTLR